MMGTGVEGVTPPPPQPSHGQTAEPTKSGPPVIGMSPAHVQHVEVSNLTVMSLLFSLLKKHAGVSHDEIL